MSDRKKRLDPKLQPLKKTVFERLDQLEQDQREVAGAHIAFVNHISQRVLEIELSLGLAKDDEPMSMVPGSVLEQLKVEVGPTPEPPPMEPL